MRNNPGVGCPAKMERGRALNAETAEKKPPEKKE
jgi:hypothetical protein